MSNIILFQFESNEIRTGELDGSPVFCLSDLLNSMGSKTDTDKAKASIGEVFGDGSFIELPIIDSIGREQLVPFVRESGATFLISRSRTEKGKRMNRWIHNEVLPSIRKTGSYSVKAPAASLAEWHEDRLQGKVARRSLTDTIKILCEYAAAQGSTKPEKYYIHFSNLVNKYVIAAPIDSKIKDKRNRMTGDQLHYVRAIETVLTKLIDDQMTLGDDYHEIYSICKDRVAAIAVVLDIDPQPLLEQSNQRLINQSLTRSLKASK